MSAAAYGVKHKQTGLFFVGFNNQQQLVWGKEAEAKQFDRTGASQQALLLTRFGVNVQKKPVSL